MFCLTLFEKGHIHREVVPNLSQSLSVIGQTTVKKSATDSHSAQPLKIIYSSPPKNASIPLHATCTTRTRTSSIGPQSCGGPHRSLSVSNAHPHRPLPIYSAAIPPKDSTTSDPTVGFSDLSTPLSTQRSWVSSREAANGKRERALLGQEGWYVEKDIDRGLEE